MVVEQLVIVGKIAYFRPTGGGISEGFIETAEGAEREKSVSRCALLAVARCG